MYYVYILKSKRNNKRYTGYTSKEPDVRLKEHNFGKEIWTKQNGPFELIYTERFQTKEEAVRRERYLKTGNGRRFLDNIIPRFRYKA